MDSKKVTLLKSIDLLHQIYEDLCMEIGAFFAHVGYRIKKKEIAFKVILSITLISMW